MKDYKIKREMFVMKNKNQEKKSFKEVLAENKGKILAGAGVVTAGVLGLAVYKNSKDLNTLVKVNSEIVELNKLQGDLNERMAEAAKKAVDHMKLTRRIAEEGALQEAIKSVEGKIKYRVGKIEAIGDRIDLASIAKKEIYEKELETLIKDRDMFKKLWDNMIHNED